MQACSRIRYYAACGAIRGLTSVRFFRLMHYASTIERLWTLSVDEMRAAGLESEAAQQIVQQRNGIDPQTYYEGIKKNGIHAVCFEDEQYPSLLKEISNPPYVLFYRGRLPDASMELIGVVGTRNLTNYGTHITPRIASDLTQNGYGIVSGLARGIDTLAHRACLDRNGIAIAVLGTGVDDASIYPSQNRALAHRIIEQNGCVVSEYAPGTSVQAYHFPARNRIISGLCRGVIVIEAAERSGALITARHALDQNRDVFAVPGPIYNPMSAGPHALIKQGAIPITSSADVCDHYDRTIDTGLTRTKISGENDNERTLLRHLSHEPQSIDELCRMCDLDTKVVASTLMVMEMKRMVRNVGTMRYVVS